MVPPKNSLFGGLFSQNKTFKKKKKTLIFYCINMKSENVFFLNFYKRFFTLIKEDIILKNEVSFGFTTNNLRFFNIVLSMFIKKC